MRARFFGPEASTARTISAGCATSSRTAFRSVDLDIRDSDGVDRVCSRARAPTSS